MQALLPTAGVLGDRFGRTKRKLRVSLTDRCNFRCPYCMPEEPQWQAKESQLNRAEWAHLLGLFVKRLGITQLRLTGGEPLLRKDLEDCIATFSGLREYGLERISLTTNGSLLKERASALQRAGLDDLNVSLDALTEMGFARMSGRRGSPQQVMDGILAARQAGLPLKLNAVVIRNHNEQEILPLAHWAFAQDIPLRFIEFMPLDGRGAWRSERVVREDEILSQLRREFCIEPEPETDDPARYYRLNGRYRLGVISTISKPFCKRCDRLRLTATGELYSCLFSTAGRDLRTPLRDGAGDDELIAVIRRHVWHKEEGYAATGYVERPISMHALGG